jgi:hypothetical protein
MSFLLVVGFAADIAVRRRRLARSRYVETDVLLIFSRSETARIDNPCSNVSRRIDRISFTSVCLACFRLGIMSSLKTRGQSARSALTKIDLNSIAIFVRDSHGDCWVNSFYSSMARFLS